MLHHDFAHDGVLEPVVLILMAANTCVAADVVAICSGRRRRLGFFLRRQLLEFVFPRRARNDDGYQAKREDEHRDDEQLAFENACAAHENFSLPNRTVVFLRDRSLRLWQVPSSNYRPWLTCRDLERISRILCSVIPIALRRA